VVALVEFNPLSPEFFADPYDTYRRLRDEAPVYVDERFGFYALSRFADVARAHRDWQTFSSARGLRLDQLNDPSFSLPGSIIFMDPPEHDRLRKLVSRAFTPRAAERWEPIVRAAASRHLDPLMGERRIDLVEQFAAPVPCEVISTILGIPESEQQRFRHNTDLVLHREPNDPNPTPEGVRAAEERSGMLRALVADKRVRPADDMISQLIAAEVDDGEGGTVRMSDEEVAIFSGLLASAGSETVAKLIGNGIVLFDRYADQWQKVLDDPLTIPGAVEEIMRYWAPTQYQGRFSMKDSEWDGGTIPSGRPVFLLTGSANRDEREFPDADVFNIGRDRQQSIAIAFGHGLHVCLGIFLARLESRVAFEEIRARFPRYRVEEDGLRRVQMSNVAGFSNVPVEIL
jgi:cytochrome P450